MAATNRRVKAPAVLAEGAFQFSLKIVRLCQQLEKRKSMVTGTLARRALVAATATAANLEDAQTGVSARELHLRLLRARKQIRETSYWLRLMLAGGILTSALTEPLLYETDAMMKGVNTVLRRLQKR
jgi:four helix bundle protein